MTRSLVAAVVLLMTASAFAQSVVIDQIDIVTRRTSTEIVRAELRLPAGRAYTPAELDQALYRIRRLPFVVDASYAVETTSDGKHVMRVDVIDEHRFHYDFDVQGVATRGGYAVFLLGAGWRFFPGSNGVLDFDIGGAGAGGGGGGSGQFGDVSVQYTMYGIGGSSVFAGIGVSTRYDGSLVSPAALVGIPLTRTQTIRASYRRIGEANDSNSVLQAQWLFETSDDPYFARRGFEIAAGPYWQRFESERTIGSRNNPIHIETEIDSKGINAEGAMYRPLRKTSAAWLRGNVAILEDTGTTNGRERVPQKQRRGDAYIGLAHNFDGGRADETRFFRTRVELGVGYHLERYTQGDFTSDERSGAALFGGVTYRSRRGTFSLGVSYVMN